jgi:uncharacterized membrane protein YphA (DoxX/SURF4 family)
MNERTVNSQQAASLSKPLAMILLCLRITVGWHFLYEGLAKLLVPGWTSAPYLELSRGIFAGFFHGLASSPGLVRAVDLLNIWGLMLIGLALMLGCFTRLASASGIVMLALYYLAQPPAIKTDYRIPVEGHYLLIDKNVVELVALIIFLALPAGTLWGIGRLVGRWRAARAAKAEAEPATLKAPEAVPAALSRRQALEDLAAVPIAGVLGYTAHKKYEWEKVHAITGATLKLQNLSLKDLNGKMPMGNLGGLQVSRMILGGNLIGGWSHSRDLIYVSSLFKAYNTDRKVFETLELAERAGINSFLAVNSQMPLFNKYRELNNSKMLTICQVTAEDLKTDIDRAVDFGVTTIYVQGVRAEIMLKAGKVDQFGKMLDYIRSQGLAAGMGAHSLEVCNQCTEQGIEPDYYMKTLHHDGYWSAHPRENRFEGAMLAGSKLDHNQWHDNMFDMFPEKTIQFMGDYKKPWIAFKVLAGGAIKPEDGFRYAFENGADFICVGMFDFQIVEDVNICNKVLANLNRGPRPWYS